MLSTTNTRVTNLIAMIPMLTGIGRLQAWSLPTHCLHSLEKLPPLQRAFRQCVEHVQAMVFTLPGGLLAWVLPTDCLRSLGNRPPFPRAFRQSVGNAEAIGRLYDKPRQQPDGNSLESKGQTDCHQSFISIRNYEWCNRLRSAVA